MFLNFAIFNQICEVVQMPPPSLAVSALALLFIFFENGPCYLFPSLFTCSMMFCVVLQVNGCQKSGVSRTLKTSATAFKIKWKSCQSSNLKLSW